MDWLTYSGQNNRPGDLCCYNFWISNDFTQVVNFPTGITDCNSYSPALLNLFISSDARIFSTMAFPPLGNSDDVAVSVYINFSPNSKGDAPFHHGAYYIFVWIGTVFVIIWEIFKLGASAADSEFYDWV